MSFDSGAGAYSHGTAWPSPRPQSAGARSPNHGRSAFVSVTSGIIPAVSDPTVIPRELAALHAERGWPGDGGPLRITRPAAYGLLWRDGKVLLCRTSPGHLGVGRWTLPGGGIVFGEAPEAGAIREVEEETGLITEITGVPVIIS